MPRAGFPLCLKQIENALDSKKKKKKYWVFEHANQYIAISTG